VRKNHRFLSGLILLALFILPANAWAYLDAGTGSYIIQVLLASMLGLAFAFKSFWIKMVHTISGLLSRKKKDEPKPQ
jgi:hypothetical protein